MDFKPEDFRAIWITPRSLLGVPDGARHATCALIQHLTQLHAGVELISIVPSDESVDIAAVKKQFGVLSCTVIPRSRSKFLRIPSLTTPFTFRSFATTKLHDALRYRLSILLKTAPSSSNTCVVFDGLHPFAAFAEDELKDLSGQCQGIVYRAHNVETIFWQQCEEKARMPWFRLFFKHQASLVRTFETRIARSVNGIAPVSEDDAAKFRAFAPGVHVSVMPIGIDFPDEAALQPVREAGKLELLFIGRLDWLPNRAGLTWFLETIWPPLIAKRPQLSLKIAGVGDGAWLERFQNLDGVQCLGKVAEIAPLYEACALSIAPLFQGSGTRVKILESARYARAVATTALGAEGTGLVPGRTYFRVETKTEWLNLLQTITIQDCRKVGDLAFKSVRAHFDARTIAEKFLQMLKNIRH